MLNASNETDLLEAITALEEAARHLMAVRGRQPDYTMNRAEKE